MPSIRSHAVRLASHPGRLLLHPFVRRYQKRYAGRSRFPRLAFATELFVVGLIVGVLAAGIVFSLPKPRAFGDGVVFTADVAPHEVETGAASTLIIRYRNETGQDLRQARLTLGFPAHFLLQEAAVLPETAPPASQAAAPNPGTFDLGTLPAGAEGSVKIRGVMFGDVGGAQSFRSLLTFVHGAHDEPDQKIDVHSFTPTHSALALSLDMPAKLYAGELIAGTLAYRNAGPVDFPDVTITPVWPLGFALLDASAPLRAGALRVPGLAAGTAGTWTFRGRLGGADAAASFAFQPSFSFGDEPYRQETLALNRSVAAPPLRVSHTIVSLRPGSAAEATVAYENTGDVALLNASVGVETDSPLFASRVFVADAKTDPRLARIEPGASGTVTVRTPTSAHIQADDLSADGGLRVITRAYASYLLADGNVPLVSRGADLSTVPTTPFVLEAAARYAAPSGDQLGRGPLPPTVGEETTYWIFWNVRGTINPVKNLRVEGQLPAGIVFTGRQTVSQGDAVAFDEATRTVSWSPGAIDPTLPPGSKAAGAAFEVSLTPTRAQAGSAPTLIDKQTAAATDASTGDVLAASAPRVTTNLPQDSLAAGQSLVISP